MLILTKLIERIRRHRYKKELKKAFGSETISPENAGKLVYHLLIEDESLEESIKRIKNEVKNLIIDDRRIYLALLSLKTFTTDYAAFRNIENEKTRKLFLDSVYNELGISLKPFDSTLLEYVEIYIKKYADTIREYYDNDAMFMKLGGIFCYSLDKEFDLYLVMQAVTEFRALSKTLNTMFDSLEKVMV